ncbi:hypothetical protein SNOG_07293 [Parastagonospora nodorum SN15]|uniref:Uncharacterized protein n=1 Tax=Phaeosphaeria nodorum (strain SN15 / ATCC MYA-4574 / FGSC 10173) TaxID=321614 RepID=Q0ULS1_PHANO|nr:hypothetical protein SNOG_07293 [Parastagonospora nodorum SN15]EAT84759.1 hypothetical protein SNOG_07293 [Parastagonospora nodorum SN15]
MFMLSTRRGEAKSGETAFRARRVGGLALVLSTRTWLLTSLIAESFTQLQRVLIPPDFTHWRQHFVLLRNDLIVKELFEANVHDLFSRPRVKIYHDQALAQMHNETFLAPFTAANFVYLEEALGVAFKIAVPRNSELLDHEG